MRTLFFSIVAALGLLALPAPAADLTQAVMATASISALAKLTISPATLLFPDSDPDITPLIAAASGPVSISAKARTAPGGQVTLTLLANDDLRSGMDVIAIDALRWSATGPGFLSGTASRTTAQTVGRWGASGQYSGTQSFVLANDWTQAAGTYTVTLTYTLATE
ncbi:MAG TPA: hypothetical protein VK886_22730 [Vicinamibacterales bacterium]|nr:hypothetical protein [Vicinamibacterales bacterium]